MVIDFFINNFRNKMNLVQSLQALCEIGNNFVVSAYFENVTNTTANETFIPRERQRFSNHSFNMSERIIDLEELKIPFYSTFIAENSSLVYISNFVIMLFLLFNLFLNKYHLKTNISLKFLSVLWLFSVVQVYLTNFQSQEGFVQKVELALIVLSLIQTVCLYCRIEEYVYFKDLSDEYIKPKMLTQKQIRLNSLLLYILSVIQYVFNKI